MVAPSVHVVVLAVGVLMRVAVLVVRVESPTVHFFVFEIPLQLTFALVERVEWVFEFLGTGRWTSLGRLDGLGLVCGSTPLIPRWSSCFGIVGRCLEGSSVLRIGHCTCGFDLKMK